MLFRRNIKVRIKVSGLENLDKALKKVEEIRKSHPNISVNIEVA